MRPPRHVKAFSPLPLLLFTPALLSTSPLVTASIIPFIRPRSPSPVPNDPTPSSNDFQELGTVDNITGGTPTTPYSPSESSSVSPFDATEQQELDIPSSETLMNLSTSFLSDSTPPNTCASSPLWYTKPLLTSSASPPAVKDFVTDCYLAVQHLYLTDVHFNARSNVELEFVAPTGSSGLQDGMSHTYMKGDWVEQTPILFEANTCTLAIVMMGHFLNVTHDLGGRGVLPGGIARGGLMGSGGRRGGAGPKGGVSGLAGKDSTTWRKLHTAGRIVENECLKQWGRGGWVSAGENEDIGVFLWATNSTLDLKFRPAIEHTTQLIGSGSGTSSENGTSSELLTATPAPSPSVAAKGSNSGGEPRK